MNDLSICYFVFVGVSVLHYNNGGQNLKMSILCCWILHVFCFYLSNHLYALCLWRYLTGVWHQSVMRLHDATFGALRCAIAHRATLRALADGRLAVSAALVSSLRHCSVPCNLRRRFKPIQWIACVGGSNWFNWLLMWSQPWHCSRKVN